MKTTTKTIYSYEIGDVGTIVENGFTYDVTVMRIFKRIHHPDYLDSINVFTEVDTDETLGSATVECRYVGKRTGSHERVKMSIGSFENNFKYTGHIELKPKEIYDFLELELTYA